MAGRAGLSQSAVSHIWRALALQPHRTEMFKLSKDPLFIEKVEILSGSTWTRRTEPWSSAWMRRRNFSPWIGPRRCCP